jgi:hypothetical protein
MARRWRTIGNSGRLHLIFKSPAQREPGFFVGQSIAAQATIYFQSLSPHHRRIIVVEFAKKG